MYVVVSMAYWRHVPTQHHQKTRSFFIERPHWVNTKTQTHANTQNAEGGCNYDTNVLMPNKRNINNDLCDGYNI